MDRFATRRPLGTALILGKSLAGGDQMRRELEGGKLVLFQRNGVYQARIPIGSGRYLWKSLKTSNIDEAERLGRRLFYQTETKLEEGLAVQSRSFAKVIEEFITHRERDDPRMLYQIKRVSPFWVEFAGRKATDAIDDRVLREFIGWRKNYYVGKPLPKNAKLHPTDKSLQFDLMIGKMVVRWAHDKGYRGTRPMPTFAYTPKNVRVRPHISATEFRKIRDGFRAWIDEPVHSEDWRRTRQLLYYYVHLLWMTGLRTGEANALKVRDIHPIVDIDGRSTVQLAVRGKTGMRMCQAHVNLKPVLDEMLQRRGDVSPDDLLFVMPDGGKVISLNDQFTDYMKHIGLTHSADGTKYVLYSLRHGYAVRALGRTDIFSVAQNLGTSVEMIQAYYGNHGISPERARKLAGEYNDPQRGPEPIRERKK